MIPLIKCALPRAELSSHAQQIGLMIALQHGIHRAWQATAVSLPCFISIMRAWHVSSCGSRVHAALCVSCIHAGTSIMLQVVPAIQPTLSSACATVDNAAPCKRKDGYCPPIVSADVWQNPIHLSTAIKVRQFRTLVCSMHTCMLLVFWLSEVD